MEKRKLFLLGLGGLVLIAVLAVLLWPDQPAVRRLTGRRLAPAEAVAVARPGQLKDLAGDWLLFIHYDDSTLTAELKVDRQGRTLKSSQAIAQELKFSFCADGSLLLANQKLRLKGLYDPDEGYVSGTAVSGWPVPFSARRLTETR